MEITIQEPLPPGLGDSYPPLRWAKYGVCWWIYENFAGETEWINQLHWCTEPKYGNPTMFQCRLAKGVSAILMPRIIVRTDITGMVINGVTTSLQTGRNMPFVVP
jgi:hypothetical protein